MNDFTRQHVRAFSLTFKQILNAPFINLLSVVIIGVALSLPVGLYVVLLNLQGLVGRLPDSPQLTVFMKLEVTPQETQVISSKIQQQPHVRQTTFVSKQEALQQMKQRSGFADVIAALPENPLPDAFVVTADSTDPALLEALHKTFQAWPTIDYVQLDSLWLKRLNALLDIGEKTVLILGVLLGFALVVITGNTIRMQILTRREEIEVSKLIGASNTFIRRPFLYYGVLQGLGGGIVATVIVVAAGYLLNPHVVRLAALYGAQFNLTLLNVADSLSLLVFASWLCWLGSYFSVSRHLQYIEPS